MNELLKTFNPTISALFEVAFTQSKFCQKIDTLDWKKSEFKDEKGIKVIEHGLSFIETQELEEKLTIKRNKQRKLWRVKDWLGKYNRKVLVEVKMLRTDWIFKTKNVREKNKGQN